MGTCTLSNSVFIRPEFFLLVNLLEIENIFLPLIFSICFGCSKEPSH